MTDATYIYTALTTGCPPQWIQQTALHVRPNKHGSPYDTTQAAFYPEVTIRIPTGQTTRRGYPKPQRRRLDLVALVRLNYRAWQPVIIGIEIKASQYDLLSDAKLPQYLPYCDLFFLAAPAELHTPAKERIAADLPGCGLVLIYADHIARIVQLPALVPPDHTRRAELLGELLMHQFTRNGENP